jgi:hypothetical protein
MKKVQWASMLTIQMTNSRVMSVKVMSFEPPEGGGANMNLN